MELDLPEVIAEVRAAFDRYERALGANDVATLDTIFWNNPRTIRYGSGENLYGHGEIAAFRGGRTPPGARTLAKTVISTYGRDTRWLRRYIIARARPEKSAGRCKPGCAFRKAGGLSPHMSASSTSRSEGSTSAPGASRRSMQDLRCRTCDVR